MEFSIILSGGCKCNAMCSYCSAHLVEQEDVVVDLDAIIKTMKSNKMIQEAVNKGEKLFINLWGGEPLIHLEYYGPLMERLEKEFEIGVYFLSTNGIPLADKKVIKWIYENNKRVPMKIQISHDGLGQKERTKTFDPFYAPSTRDTIVKLAKDGIFNLINCTISSKNPSIMANMFYFNKFFLDNGLSDLVDIKLNHINDSDYCSDYDFKGPELNTYIHELEIAFMDCYKLNKDFGDCGNAENANKKFPKWWRPFQGYFVNQLMRDNLYEMPGGCGQFATGMRDETWCINTKGEYVACQLWDTNDGIQNMKLEMPEYCDSCEYKKYNECHPCPNSTYPDECKYRKEFIRLILRIKEYRTLMDEVYNRIPQRETCRCGEKCDCR